MDCRAYLEAFLTISARLSELLASWLVGQIGTPRTLIVFERVRFLGSTSFVAISVLVSLISNPEMVLNWVEGSKKNGEASQY